VSTLSRESAVAEAGLSPVESESPWDIPELNPAPNDRVYYVWVLLSLAAPAALGGLCTQSWRGALLGLIWGGLVRIFVTHHITWSINSICHVIGRRHFKSGDHSRNNLICGIFGFGEGWHNNHQAFPVSARHGLLWWQFDASWLIIRTMQLTGLAWNVRLPEARMLEAKRLGT
jgi:stearoyl-CoA desaturase (delta-9 desaturase)